MLSAGQNEWSSVASCSEVRRKEKECGQMGLVFRLFLQTVTVGKATEKVTKHQWPWRKLANSLPGLICPELLKGHLSAPLLIHLRAVTTNLLRPPFHIPITYRLKWCFDLCLHTGFYLCVHLPGESCYLGPQRDHVSSCLLPWRQWSSHPVWYWMSLTQALGFGCNLLRNHHPTPAVCYW